MEVSEGILGTWMPAIHAGMTMICFLSSVSEPNHESLDGQICGSMPKLCSSCFQYPRSLVSVLASIDMSIPGSIS